MHIPHRAVALTASLLAAAAALPAQGGSATYQLTFATTWSAQTHPQAFPPNPHFSPLIGGTHDAATSFWEVGGLASNGIEQMAETGATTLLTNEVRAAITAGGADQVVQGSGLGTSPASRAMSFTITAEYSHLTLVSMLAPSPDWFVGVSGLDLRPGGVWVDNLVVPLFVYDSGTDSGTSYRSPNQNTVPPDPIARVTTASGPFQGLPDPIGTFTLRRVASSSVYGCGINPPGSMTVTDGMPLLAQSVTLGLHDPTGTLSTPSATAIIFAAAPDAAYPCGTPVPGLGIAGANGELLISVPLLTLPGPAWNGTTASVQLGIPNLSGLVGGSLYLQGAMADGATVGLTDAVELLIGNL